MEKASGVHLKDGAKRVIISTPSADAPMIVMGVNHKKYDNSLNIVRNASCTTNCLLSLAKVIHDNLGIKKGLMAIFHAITVGGSFGKLWCKGHRAAQNIPASTGTARAISKVIPRAEWETHWHGLPCSYRQGVHHGSNHLEKVAKCDDINKVVNQASEGPLKDILGYTKDKVVS
ncbi:glyceraldehyde-3-phosphate dehydrogenase-like [Apodemus sylvaticus]|uniref:glyceraldehyde-3-phosphate dehydrogenase-like n=1 Tax=Apodemus sylvaticus TaxID=10129 RepID=UPI002243897E|nr:glyceraldehyde-3-phosphate dehydrogenase-like [Apodemus sylvaticus]